MTMENVFITNNHNNHFGIGKMLSEKNENDDDIDIDKVSIVINFLF